MKLNTYHLALATALVWMMVYTLCVLMAAVAPGSHHALGAAMSHLADDAPLGAPPDWTGYLGGLAVTTTGMALIVATFGWIYNLLEENGESGN